MGINTKSIVAVRDALAGVHDAFGMPHLVCLLSVAAEPGMSVNELAERTGYPQQSVSRYTALLLGRYESVSAPPLEHAPLEQSINPVDPRKRALHLSAAGEALVQAFISSIASGVN